MTGDLQNPQALPRGAGQESRGPQVNTVTLEKGVQVSKAHGWAWVPAKADGWAQVRCCLCPVGHPGSHFTLDTWRSRGQGQQPLGVVRFAKGPSAASFSPKDPKSCSVITPWSLGPRAPVEGIGRTRQAARSQPPGGISRLTNGIRGSSPVLPNTISNQSAGI